MLFIKNIFILYLIKCVSKYRWARVSPDLALARPWTGPGVVGPALEGQGQGQQNCPRAGLD